MMKSMRELDSQRSLERNNYGNNQVRIANYKTNKQYNGDKLDRYLYPTRNKLGKYLVSRDNITSEQSPQRDNHLLVLKTQESSPSIDIHKLKPQHQREFLRLEDEYEATFVQQHNHKIKITKNQYSQGLAANLKRDRI